MSEIPYLGHVVTTAPSPRQLNELPSADEGHQVCWKVLEKPRKWTLWYEVFCQT